LDWIPVFQVDAFTARRFRGNPAGVCLLEKPADEAWMQAAAREMNLSETAFLVREGDIFSLRWFTPSVEVDLCGHATLASAHVLWAEGLLGRESTARFSTRSGELRARLDRDWIELDFPADPPSPCPAPRGFDRALGAKPVALLRGRFDLLAELGSEKEVLSLDPDFRLLARIPARGVIVTARSGSGDFDFVSRFFAPAVGVDEDPVTGSAHCCLGPYWGGKLGRREMTGLQVS
jgi:PhzF family phenazine biosynthesis protein